MMDTFSEECGDKIPQETRIDVLAESSTELPKRVQGDIFS